MFICMRVCYCKSACVCWGKYIRVFVIMHVCEFVYSLTGDSNEVWKAAQTDETKILPTEFVFGVLPLLEKLGDIAKTAEKDSSLGVMT